MRIWDLPPEKLCKKHLLGEHSELHAIWSIITNVKKGYSFHPEVTRWKGKLKALYIKHEEIVNEMKKRGYKHNSPLNILLAIGKDKQDKLIDSISKQKMILKNKDCKCKF
jgi:DNA-binding winged helix-turn-helix (wHTH) protein